MMDSSTTPPLSDGSGVTDAVRVQILATEHSGLGYRLTVGRVLVGTPALVGVIDALLAGAFAALARSCCERSSAGAGATGRAFRMRDDPCLE
jgi:hypothetical protein